jgi:hypothetical protein
MTLLPQNQITISRKSNTATSIAEEPSMTYTTIYSGTRRVTVVPSGKYVEVFGNAMGKNVKATYLIYLETGDPEVLEQDMVSFTIFGKEHSCIVDKVMPMTLPILGKNREVYCSSEND